MNEINLVHFETGLGIIPNYEIFHWLAEEVGEVEGAWTWTREPFTVLTDMDATIVGAFLFHNSDDALRFKLRWCNAE